MIRVTHDHVPVYRVVRQGHKNALDASFSRKKGNNRWNTEEFSALYCACSMRVARAVVRDLFRVAGVEASELKPAWRPKLVALTWSGSVVDATGRRSLAAAGLPADYPLNVTKDRTRVLAVGWHSANCEGVVARSASLSRLGLRRFAGDHSEWSELAIFVDRAENQPRLAATQPKANWLLR